MTYRIHTADPKLVDVQLDTVQNIDEELGYDHTEDEAGQSRIIFNDLGNMEAFILTGTIEEWEKFRDRLGQVIEMAKRGINYPRARRNTPR